MAIYFPKSKFAFDSDPDRQGYVVGNTLYPVEFVHREGWVTGSRLEAGEGVAGTRFGQRDRGGDT